MSLSQKIAGELPFLRRYARALSGSQVRGDAIVKETLEKALGDEALKKSLEGGREALYRVFHLVLDERGMQAQASSNTDAKEQSALAKLSAMTDQTRQALLLTTVEGFNTAQAAQIMGIGADAVDQLNRAAIAQIDAEQRTSVLVIEDEPMILMQLEDLVLSLGHEISGTATTKSEAIQSVKENQPGLILADIQLADGSSGLDAVKDIMEIAEVPVVFITAYPERLLTGDRVEPTYLVTKPFREDTVKASISQALFFG
ncbi:response regulator [Erythrobacter sp. SCSIO 43205]|uniref:response regulator n=1 Tax=Erythrobacter sp. SCSIO 43205 TaxID=2779361 RepID=UPI001CA82D17|nr:response regulator [Erythrobacter sp. SCSIO 43205]UAB78116.1 response regulator [Erythrobacter sp. SCSIO 43205]